jgi:6-phosphogluconolactonase
LVKYLFFDIIKTKNRGGFAMPEQNTYIGYVGTYTKKDSEGIYFFALDTKEGKISEVKVAAKVQSPTYLAVSGNNRFLYSVAQNGDSAGIAAFTLDDSTGELSFNNQQVSNGTAPCHVWVDDCNRFAFASYYHRGTLEVYTLNPESGEISPSPTVIQHKGSGPDYRQDRARIHFASFTPDEKFIVVADLGIDKIVTYELKTGELSEVCSLGVKPGSGPRHIVFHFNQKFAYCLTELSSEVIVLEYDSDNGQFKPVQTISTIPADFTENNQSSAIHLSSDGRFVYAGNRGHNSIAVFSVNQETYKLSFVELVSSEGNWPRDFVLDPSEKFLVASNQESGNLVLFSRDPETGKLTLLQSDIAVPEPTCVKFLHN